MKNSEKIIWGIISGIILSGILIIAFYVSFIVGTFETNRSKPLPADIVSAGSDNLKNSDKDFILTDLDLYFKQGTVYANIYLENNLSLKDSEIVLRSLKEFFLQDRINKYIGETHNTHFSIYAVIHSKDNTYHYSSSYYLHNDNDNSSTINNYRVWYLLKSTGETITSINID